MKLTLYLANCTGNPNNNLYPIKAEVSSAADLAKAIKKDHVCGAFQQNKRSVENFISSDCIVMDCDNDFSDSAEDWINPDDIPTFFPGVSLAVTQSRHHNLVKDGKSARPRFHVYFAIKELSDPAAYKMVKEKIQSTYHIFDSNAMDAARFIFGCDNDEVIWINGNVTVDQYLRISPSQTIPQGQRNSHMSHFAGRIIKKYGITDKAYEAFCMEAAKCDPPLDEAELEKIWTSATKFGQRIMSQDGYIPPEKYNSDFDENDLSFKPNDFSDIGQAEVLARHCHNQLRYSDGTDYIRFVKDHWVETKAQQYAAAEEFLKMQLADARNEVSRTKEALVNSGVDESILTAGKKGVPSGLSLEQIKLYIQYVHATQYLAFVMKRRDMKYVKAALEAAKPMLEIDTDELDHDEFLLNTPAGTYDLHEGVIGMKPHDPEDLITKITKVSPDNQGSELWQKCLDTVFCGDEELLKYVQQVVGLSAIGKVYREVLIISYGEGSNGKSTFWNTINEVLGSYGGQISAETLTTGNRANVKPEIAEMKGKRLIIASELQEGQRLNTAMVKKLCSTDKIFAEKKYKSPFGFTPSHTIVLYTNHLPKVGASDKGTWRRLVVIPFNAVITETNDIKNYSSYLVENAGGSVLAWIIEGAQMVIKNDFKIETPQSVLDAINKYRDENDWLGHFIDECCDIDKTYTEKSGDLYKSYRQYCLENGEYIRSTTDFYSALDNASFERRKKKTGMIVYGLRLKYGMDFLS